MGVNYAHISADDEPGGMFRQFPIFQRLISWTKPYSLAKRGTREYERYDWNSLIADEPQHQGLVAEFMDGSSYFPSRPEMEQGTVAFTNRTGLNIRYGCRWEGTRTADDGFVLETSAGEYHSKVAIFAIGMTEPWKPDIKGLDLVPHYVETKEPRAYAGKRVFLIGKRNSGFELADGLLPWATQIVLASPRPAALSVITRSLVGARARYVQPYEDHLLAGGNVVVDAAIERVERTGSGYRVHAKGTTRPGDLTLDVDEVIAATGFKVPLGDLPRLGVATFMQERLPAQTPWWESPSVPGIYFAGSVTQGSVGMKKYGIPGNSAAVHGFRYNARVLCRHIAEDHLGMSFEDPVVEPSRLADHLLEAATHAPELWNQRSYLAHVVELDPERGPKVLGIRPLADFVDLAGPDSVAITVETDSAGDIHPAVYVRAGGKVDEHLLQSAPFHDYETADHRKQVVSVLDPLLR
jgi:thioredoxin reductase